MRRHVVLLVALIAVNLVVLCVTLRSTDEPLPPLPPPLPVVVDPNDCLAPVRVLPAFRIDELQWSDVVDGNPDPVVAALVIGEHETTWQGPLASQHTNLTVGELAELRAALAFTCLPRPDVRSGNGFVGRYERVAFAPAAPTLFEITRSSEAAFAVRALIDRVGQRYHAARLPVAKLMSIELDVPQSRGVRRHRLTVTPAGKIFRASGDEIGELGPDQQVNTLDWLLTLPAALADPHAVRGTFKTGGTAQRFAWVVNLPVELEGIWGTDLIRAILDCQRGEYCE